jgi:hypothetical protein
VKRGLRPPPSTHLKTSDGETLDRDENGNAISLNARGRRVPRLPFIELGEARFITGFLGSYDGVKTIDISAFCQWETAGGPTSGQTARLWVDFAGAHMALTDS